MTKNISLDNLGRVPTPEFYDALNNSKNSGDNNLYLQIAEKTIQNFPKYYLGYFCKAEALLNLGGEQNLQLAKESALKAFSLDATNINNLQVLSKIFFELQDFQNALSTIGTALQQNPYSPLMLKNYAITALRLNKLQEAFENIKQAIIFEPDDLQSWEILESMLPNANEREQVKFQLRQQIQQQSHQIHLQKLLQQAADFKANYQIMEAISVLQQAEKYAEQQLFHEKS